MWFGDLLHKFLKIRGGSCPPCRPPWFCPFQPKNKNNGHRCLFEKRLSTLCWARKWHQKLRTFLFEATKCFLERCVEALLMSTFSDLMAWRGLVVKWRRFQEKVLPRRIIVQQSTSPWVEDTNRFDQQFNFFFAEKFPTCRSVHYHTINSRGAEASIVWAIQILIYK